MKRKIYFFLYAVFLLIAAIVYPGYVRAEEAIVVNVSVNSVSRGDFFVIRNAKGDFFVKRADFPALGIQLPPGAADIEIEKERHVALSSLTGLDAVFDEKKLSLSITAPVGLLQKTMLDLSFSSASLAGAYLPKEKGVFLNYAVNYSYNNPDGFQEFMVVNKLGARAGDFFFITDSQYRKTELASDFVRLMSSITYERPQNLQWIIWGDMFATSGGLGSTINIGGLGISKAYQMDPYLIRQPTLNFAGAAALPSQVDIYVDGILSSRQNIQPGQFELQNLNYYGGTRNVDLVIKDAFGIEQRFQYSVYFARTLLKRQLHEYSYNIGFLREQYGIESNDYGKPALSAFHRYGATDWLTIGASGEAADDIYNGSIQSTFLIPNAGVVTLELAGSDSPSGYGWAGSLSHSYQNRRFGSSLLFTKYSPDYATIGGALSSSRINYMASIGASYATASRGAFSVGYSHQNSYDTGNRQVISANYLYNLTRSLTLGIITQAIKTDTADTDYQFFINLNYHSAKGVHASAQYQSTRDGNAETVQIYNNQPVGEGLNYNIVASRNAGDSSGTTDYSLKPRVQYNGRYGTYTWDSSFQNGDNIKTDTHNISVAGSVVYTGGFWGLTRPVNDSFSFVIVDNLPDVPVKLSNQEMGNTDSSGIMIIPTMRSYNVNQIEISSNNIPLDYRISEVNRKIFPTLWSGSCISFDTQKIMALTGTLLTQKEGKKMTLEYADISIKVGEKKLSYPTGKGGEFYLENSLPEDAGIGIIDNRSCRVIAERRKSGGNRILPGTYQATAEYEGGKCEFPITFPKTEEAIIDLGEIQCVGSQASTQTRPLNSLKELSGEQRTGNSTPKYAHESSNDQSSTAEPASSKPRAARVVLFAFPDAD